MSPIAATALLTLTACTRDYALVEHPDDPIDALIEVAPDHLDYGLAEEGEVAVQALRVHNIGTVAADVSVVITPAPASFTVLEPSLPATVTVGDTLEVAVAYEPHDAVEVAVAEVYLEDREFPEDVVELLGSLAVRMLEVEPAVYDFGPTGIGCAEEVTLTLTSVGELPVRVESLAEAGEGFALLEPPSLPVDLEPGDSLEVEVQYQPLGNAASEGTLWVGADTDAGRHTAVQTGEGTEELFCLGYDEGASFDLSFVFDSYEADIAFLLDTTGSMSGTASQVASGFQSIASKLAEAREDFTYGFATFDDYNYSSYGAGEDKPFDLQQQQTTNVGLVQAALDAISIHSGGDGPESGIEALYQAATGAGYDQDCSGTRDRSTDVSPFVASASDAFKGRLPGTYDAAVEGTGELGGMGFRDSAVPIFVLATDNYLRDPDAGYPSPGGCPFDAGASDTISAILALEGQFIGIAVTNLEPLAQMEALAAATGSYGDMDGDGLAEEAAISFSSGSLADTVADAIVGLAGHAHFDRVTLEVVTDPCDIVLSIAPRSYEDVEAGTELEFTVELYLPAGTEATAECLTAELHLVGDERVVLEATTVTLAVEQGGVGGRPRRSPAPP